MFDFAWSEIALIGIVALIAIGPKDMPVAIRALSQMVKKARRMAGEFQTHVDEMVREANLHEVRQQISEIRNFDIKGTVERAVDPDGELRSTLSKNPLAPDAPAPGVPSFDVANSDVPAPDVQVAAHGEATIARPEDADPAPAFIPPAAIPVAAPAPAKLAEAPPSFIPPGAHRG